MSAKILVIDDDDLVRRTLETTLLRAGYEVVTAPEGERGLKLLESESPDVVITDILMPGKEGIETIIALRRSHAKLPVIAISGGGPSRKMEYLHIARELGATKVLPKPFSNKDLLAAVAEALDDSAGS